MEMEDSEVSNDDDESEEQENSDALDIDGQESSVEAQSMEEDSEAEKIVKRIIVTMRMK